MDHGEDHSWQREENPNFSTSEDRSMENIFFKVGPFTFLVILTRF